MFIIVHARGSSNLFIFFNVYKHHACTTFYEWFIVAHLRRKGINLVITHRYSIILFPDNGELSKSMNIWKQNVCAKIVSCSKYDIVINCWRLGFCDIPFIKYNDICTCKQIIHNKYFYPLYLPGHVPASEESHGTVTLRDLELYAPVVYIPCGDLSHDNFVNQRFQSGPLGNSNSRGMGLP